MIDIPLKAKVLCTDGHAGTTTAIIIDPVKRIATHVVVESIKYLDFLVPLELVANTKPDSVHLQCTIAKMHELHTFTETHYIHDDIFDDAMYMGSQYIEPYATMVPDYSGIVEEEHIPLGELAVHRGATVYAEDGRIGLLEEFIVESETGHVTHIVLSKGHLWGKRDMVIPVTAIDRGEYDSLYLNVTKGNIQDLPGVTIQRHYQGQE